MKWTRQKLVANLDAALQFVATRAPKTIPDKASLMLALKKAIDEAKLPEINIPCATGYGLVELEIDKMLVDDGYNNHIPIVTITLPRIVGVQIDSDFTLFSVQLAELTQFANELQNRLNLG